MALALLYCNDPDFTFDKSEINVLVKAIKELDEPLLDFFLMSCKQEKNNNNCPYPISEIAYNMPIVQHMKLDVETVYVYVNELIRLRLLLPDASTSWQGDPKNWTVFFGVTEQSDKMVRFFEKACRSTHKLFALSPIKWPK